MRLMTCNVNGIRSAYQKGFWKWVNTQKFDIVCLQEVRAHEDKIPKPIREDTSWHQTHVYAKKPGYSGVSLLSKKPPLSLQTKMRNSLADSEGRFVKAEFDKFDVVSIYFPSGSSGDERQKIKYQFMAAFERRMKTYLKSKKPSLICGDWNIAHQKRDIKNWRGNQKNSGFLPEERAWLDKVFGKWGYLDTFRELNDEEDQFTWWSNRGQAYQKNVGWRIDYQVATPNLKNKIKKVEIYKEQKFSDHAPLIVEYDL